MFFTISKILWIILSPLNLVFITLMLGILVSGFSKVAGRSITVLGMLLFILFGIFPVGSNLLARLENYYERPAQMPERVDGILVLGGSFMSDISEQRGVAAFNETGERVIDALAVARRYPNAILVFSGGNGRLGGGTRTEAQDVAQFLSEFSYPEDNVIYEDRSRTTYENIKYSKEYVLPGEAETWLLVTSANHMPRAMAVARQLGWGDIIPYPADYRTTGKTDWMPHDFDILGHMYDAHVALHEYLGIFAYQLGGKISLPLK